VIIIFCTAPCAAKSRFATTRDDAIAAFARDFDGQGKRGEKGKRGWRPIFVIRVAHPEKGTEKSSAPPLAFLKEALERRSI